MSVFYPVIGVLEEAISLRPANTSSNDLKTLASTETIVIIGLTIANEDSSSQLVSVWYTADSTDYLIYTGTVAANSTATGLLDAPIGLSGRFGTRKIKVQAAIANKVTFTVVCTGTNGQGR